MPLLSQSPGGDSLPSPHVNEPHCPVFLTQVKLPVLQAPVSPQPSSPRWLHFRWQQMLLTQAFDWHSPSPPHLAPSCPLDLHIPLPQNRPEPLHELPQHGSPSSPQLRMHISPCCSKPLLQLCTVHLPPEQRPLPLVIEQVAVFGAQAPLLQDWHVGQLTPAQASTQPEPWGLNPGLQLCTVQLPPEQRPVPLVIEQVALFGAQTPLLQDWQVGQLIPTQASTQPSP